MNITFIQPYIPLLHIIVSFLIVAFVLLQQRGTGLGSSFGGGDGTFFATRRGLQQKLYVATWALGAAFIALALLNIVA